MKCQKQVVSVCSGGSRPSDNWGGERGAGHSDPEIRERGRSQNFFSALRASVSSRNKGNGGGGGEGAVPSPGSATV